MMRYYRKKWIAAAMIMMIAAFVYQNNIAKADLEADLQVLEQELLVESREHRRVEKIRSFLSSRMLGFSEQDLWEISNHIVQTSDKYKFSPLLILSVMATESTFRHKVVSRMGAVGLMQVKPSTAAPIAQELKLAWNGKKTLEDPIQNISIGVHYLAYLRDRFEDPEQFITAYNFGPSRIYRMTKRKRRLPLFYYKRVQNYYRRFEKMGIAI